MKIRAAVVGVGYLGTFHAQKYKALSTGTLSSNLEFVGVCDLNAQQANKVATELGVKAFNDPKELIGKVDAVTISTITPAHYETALMFLKNGIHTNIEKPITETSKQAEELVEIAKSKNLIIGVGHSERFSPAFRYILDRKQNMRYCELHRHAPFKLRGSEVSVVHDLMIHDIDLALSLDSSPFEVETASSGCVVTKTFDWASCSLKFKSGLKVLITSSRMAPQMTRQVKAFYDDQVITANLQTGDVEITSSQLTKEGQVQTSVTAMGKSDNLLSETENFINSILKKQRPFISGDDGLRALKVAEEIIARAKK
jgi:predicted dehydrogenase